MRRYIVTLLVLATAAAAVKVYGAFVGSSKALLIDGLTSIANLVAAIGVIHYSRYEKLPADRDHPYGHYRLSLAGILVILMAYSFVAGVGIPELINVEPYRVLSVATTYAVFGLILYLITISLAKFLGSKQLTTYAIFTYSEVFESIVTIAAVVGGYMLSWIIDWVGGLCILSFLMYELVKTAKEFIESISDVAPPKEVVDKVYSTARKYGLNVANVRIRKVVDGVYQGEVCIVCNSSNNLMDVFSNVMKFEEQLRSYGIDVCVRISNKQVSNS